MIRRADEADRLALQRSTGLRRERRALLVMIIAAALQAASSFGSELLFGQMRGWAILLHVSTAPLFIAGLTVLTLAGAARRSLDPVAYHNEPAAGRGGRLAAERAAELLFWTVVVLGWLVMSTMLAAMLPYFGQRVQYLLLETHERCAIALLPSLTAYAVLLWSTPTAPPARVTPA